MKFKHGTRRRALEYEKDWVKRWKADKTFEKSVEKNPKSESYVFYDGPPFISGVPHHGTLLSSIVKDAVPRYQTMKGKRVERVWGWDAHGLPAERFTEKKLGIHSRQEVIEYGIENYINATRANMLETSSAWEDVVDRVGRWVDFKGAYKTMDRDYMESIWWAFKTLYEKGKIYEGERVLMYCTLDGTPLSKAEVTMDAGAYQDVTEPSVYVKFKLKNPLPTTPKINKNSKVLFICAANLGRSQAATALFNFYTKSDRASGAGTEVLGNDYSEALSVRAVEELRTEKEGKKFTGHTHEALLEKFGIDIIDSPRRQLTLEMLKNYDLVVNIAEKTQTPDWLHGDNVVWWDIKDVGFQGNVDMARKNIDEIERRVKLLLDGDATDDSEVSLLAWTTTPWTLPANTALAVNRDVTYVEVELDGERLIAAKDLAPKVFTDEKHQPLHYKVTREFKGDELVGLEYEPLFVDRGENAHKIWHADYVETEAGTGIVHLAPAYGEEDFALAQEKGIPVVHVIDQNGFFTEGDWEGKNVWETNKQIAKDLKERGVVWKIDYITHSYPHCHRCGTKLMYRAHPSWFVNIDEQRTLMLEKNEPINWFPAHLKHGRFEKTIQQAPDWNISRDRFWATAMPVWKSPSGKTRVVGSYAELKELSGVELDDYHRPWVDEVTFELDGETYTRIDKVMDSWFEAGSMPFAQFHYPFENKEKFEANFPGDFIVEYIAQTRAWFYYMHALNVALFGENSFKNVITTGTLAGNDGRKMSKSYGNYTDPNELMDKFSADSLRFLLLSSPLLNGEDFALQDKEVGDVARKLSMIWNMYDFFTMYAEVDSFTFPYETTSNDAFMLKNNTDAAFPIDVDMEKLSNPLDKWIISRVHQLNEEISKNMDAYNIPDALAPVFPCLTMQATGLCAALAAVSGRVMTMAISSRRTARCTMCCSS